MPVTGGGTAWDRGHFLGRGEDWWAPHEIRLELVEGCGLRCHSCGISGIRPPGDGTIRVMDPALAQNVAAQLRELFWPTTICLTGRGEPAYHPKLDDIIEILKNTSPATLVLLETSGAGLLRVGMRRHDAVGVRFVNRVNSLMQYGLNLMVLNRREATAKMWDAVDDMAEDVVELLGARLERRYMSHAATAYDRVLCLVRDVVRAPIADNRATSHCGAGAKTWPKHGDYWRRGKFCARPAQEMVVRWDGRVGLCQEDWRGEVLLGDLSRQTVRQVWYSEPARAARARAMAGLRDLRPCSKCDWIGSRKMMVGAEHMQVAPTQDHREEMVGALLEEPMTRPVLRPWETG